MPAPPPGCPVRGASSSITANLPVVPEPRSSEPDRRPSAVAGHASRQATDEVLGLEPQLGDGGGLELGAPSQGPEDRELGQGMPAGVQHGTVLGHRQAEAVRDRRRPCRCRPGRARGGPRWPRRPEGRCSSRRRPPPRRGRPTPTSSHVDLQARDRPGRTSSTRPASSSQPSGPAGGVDLRRPTAGGIRCRRRDQRDPPRRSRRACSSTGSAAQMSGHDQRTPSTAAAQPAGSGDARPPATTRRPHGPWPRGRPTGWSLRRGPHRIMGLGQAAGRRHGVTTSRTSYRSSRLRADVDHGQPGADDDHPVAPRRQGRQRRPGPRDPRRRAAPAATVGSTRNRRGPVGGTPTASTTWSARTRGPSRPTNSTPSAAARPEAPGEPATAALQDRGHLGPDTAHRGRRGCGLVQHLGSGSARTGPGRT